MCVLEMDIDSRDRLAEILTPIIKRQGLRSYARSIGITSGAVSKWLEGDSFPNGDNRERVARSVGMTLEEFDARIVKGQEPQTNKDPLEAHLGMIMSLPPSDLARLLEAIAERLRAYDAYRPMTYPIAAELPPDYSKVKDGQFIT